MRLLTALGPPTFPGVRCKSTPPRAPLCEVTSRTPSEIPGFFGFRVRPGILHEDSDRRCFGTATGHRELREQREHSNSGYISTAQHRGDIGFLRPIHSAPGGAARLGDLVDDQTQDFLELGRGRPAEDLASEVEQDIAALNTRERVICLQPDNAQEVSPPVSLGIRFDNRNRLPTVVLALLFETRAQIEQWRGIRIRRTFDGRSARFSRYR